MTTLQRVQEAARVASRSVGGPARTVFLFFIEALEVEIEGEQRAHRKGVAERASKQTLALVQEKFHRKFEGPNRTGQGAGKSEP